MPRRDLLWGSWNLDGWRFIVELRDAGDGSTGAAEQLPILMDVICFYLLLG